MTPRLICAIILCTALLVELLMYVTYKPPKYESSFSAMERDDATAYVDAISSGFQYEDAMKEAKKKYYTIIGTTLVLGTILTFAMPNKPIRREKKRE